MVATHPNAVVTPSIYGSSAQHGSSLPNLVAPPPPRYESAALKYEYAKLAGLPPPLNLLSLPSLVARAAAGKAVRPPPKVQATPTVSDDWLSVLKKVKKEMAKESADDDDEQLAAIRKVCQCR